MVIDPEPSTHFEYFDKNGKVDESVGKVTGSEL